MDPNFTPGSDEHEQQLFQEQQDFLYSVLDRIPVKRALSNPNPNG